MINAVGGYALCRHQSPIEDIKDPEKHTLREVKLAQHLMDKKYTVDYLDRHISKAPQEIVMVETWN